MLNTFVPENIKTSKGLKLLSTFGAGENESMQRPENAKQRWSRQETKTC
jgi:hypothetical protein